MINLIFEPKVYLVGTQTVNRDELDRFMRDNEYPEWSTDTEVAGEELAEVSGRLCYRSFFRKRPGGNKAYIDHINEVAHYSVIEHAVYNFLLTGISRSLSHELVRHRIGSYSQQSQRYVDESECKFVVPPALLLEVECWRLCQHLRDGGSPASASVAYPKAHALSVSRPSAYALAVRAGLDWVSGMEQSQERYARLADYLAKKALYEEVGCGTGPGCAPSTENRKYARQAARSVLPEATETQIFVTMNARALRHFLKMRASRHADAEIRRAAYQIFLLVREASPNLFRDFKEEVLPDGSVELTTPNHEA